MLLHGKFCTDYDFCEAQARIGKGWPLRQKASKLKALPRAYIKVGCHPDIEIIDSNLLWRC